MSDNKTWVKAYKGFDKDLKCRGRQYTEGVEDHVSDVARLCKEGVHACKRPLDVFEYYDPADSVGEFGTATAGYCGAASVGNRGVASVGEFGAASVGEFGTATAGYCGSASAGDRGAATSRGKSSVGKNGIACSRSENARVKGGMGAVLVCAQENKYDCGIKTWAAGVVDGVTILPDVWYKADNGKLVPADN